MIGAFAIIDKDNDGEVDKKELRAALAERSFYNFHEVLTYARLYCHTCTRAHCTHTYIPFPHAQGRYFVAISLAEAETLRAAIHLSQLNALSAVTTIQKAKVDLVISTIHPSTEQTASYYSHANTTPAFLPPLP